MCGRQVGRKQLESNTESPFAVFWPLAKELGENVVTITINAILPPVPK